MTYEINKMSSEESVTELKNIGSEDEEPLSLLLRRLNDLLDCAYY